MIARVGGVLLLASAAVLIGGTQNKAEAGFIAYICDDAACSGGGDVIVQDESVTDGAGGSVGVVQAGGVVAGYEVTLNLAQSKPVVGSANSPAMNLTYNATNTGGGSATIWFYASDTDFTGVTALNEVFNASAGTTVSTAIFGGNSNTNLDLTNVLASAGPTVPPTGDLFLTTPTLGGGANPYSLTVGVSTSSATVASGDLKLVPEPATMSLFGLGLFSAAMAARKRKKQANNLA
jgi:hypothetical protein